MIIKTKIVDITNIIKNCPSRLVDVNIKSGNYAYAIKLDNFKGLLGFEIQPNRRIGSELADIAKRFGLGGILHSDELPKYGITNKCVQNIKKYLNCSKEDAFIILFSDSYDRALVVFEEIINRLNEMMEKVPKDTRQVNSDGTSSFLRPQPGSARMYPETDHPLIHIKRTYHDEKNYAIIRYTISIANEIKEDIFLVRLRNRDVDYYLNNKRDLEKKGFLIDKLDPIFRKDVLKSIGLDDNKIQQVIKSEYVDLFEDYYKHIDPKLIYYVVFQLKSESESQYKEKLNIDSEFILQALELLKNDVVTRYGLIKLLYLWNKERLSLRELVDKYRLRKISGKELRKKIIELYNSNRYKYDSKRMIRFIMSELKEVADPREVMEILKSIQD